MNRLLVTIVLVASVVALGCAPASATDVRVHRALFGVHEASEYSFETIHEGSVRLWDVGVQWRDVETHEDGKRYDWARLDSLVADAQAAGAEVTMVVAGTPRFYSKNPW